jgi:hypothetical protein
MQPTRTFIQQHPIHTQLYLTMPGSSSASTTYGTLAKSNPENLDSAVEADDTSTIYTLRTNISDCTASLLDTDTGTAIFQEGDLAVLKRLHVPRLKGPAHGYTGPRYSYSENEFTPASSLVASLADRTDLSQPPLSTATSRAKSIVINEAGGAKRLELNLVSTQVAKFVNKQANLEQNLSAAIQNLSMSEIMETDEFHNMVKHQDTRKLRKGEREAVTSTWNQLRNALLHSLATYQDMKRLDDQVSLAGDHGRQLSVIALAMMLTRRDSKNHLLSRCDLREELMKALKDFREMGRLEMQGYLTGLDPVDGWQAAPRST